MFASSLRRFTTLALVSLVALSASVQAASVVGASVIVAANGNVVATYRGNTASYSNDLYLDNTGMFIFNNHASAVGSTVDLGFFNAGTELEFRLHVNNTGYDFYTGPASRNADGEAHARLTDNWGAGETLVEFEDLFGGPFEFNDLSFSFTNVRTGTVGVPDASSTVGLLAIALAGMVAMRRQLK